MNQHHERLAALAALWNRIEGRAKEMEQFRGEALLASINEMRYAGRRIVDILALITHNPEGAYNEAIRDHLAVAESYLYNADHDLTDSAIHIVLKRVHRTIEQHGLSKAASCCSAFNEAYPLLLEAQEIVRRSRENRHNRLAEYRNLADKHVPRLTALYREIVENQDLAVTEPISAEIRALRNKVIWTRRFAIWGSIASIAGLFLGIVFWVFSWSTVREKIMRPSTTIQAPVTSSSDAP